MRWGVSSRRDVRTSKVDRSVDEGGPGYVGLASPAPLIIHNGENYSIGCILCVSY